MAKTIGFKLGDDAITAYTSLQRSGIDIDEFVGRCLIDEAHRLRGRAAYAAERMGKETLDLDVEDQRGVPHQIDYFRPPR